MRSSCRGSPTGRLPNFSHGFLPTQGITHAKPLPVPRAFQASWLGETLCLIPCHACSFPGLLADMLGGALNMIGFSWAASPVSTELEMVGWRSLTCLRLLCCGALRSRSPHTGLHPFFQLWPLLPPSSQLSANLRPTSQPTNPTNTFCPGYDGLAGGAAGPARALEAQHWGARWGQHPGELLCMCYLGQTLPGLPCTRHMTLDSTLASLGTHAQGTASEALLVALLAARAKALKGRPPEDAVKLVAYSSDQVGGPWSHKCTVFLVCCPGASVAWSHAALACNPQRMRLPA